MNDPFEVKASETLTESLELEALIGISSMVVMSALQGMIGEASQHGMSCAEIGQGSFASAIIFHIANGDETLTLEQKMQGLREEFERILPAAAKLAETMRTTVERRGAKIN